MIRNIFLNFKKQFSNLSLYTWIDFGGKNSYFLWQCFTRFQYELNPVKPQDISESDGNWKIQVWITHQAKPRKSPKGKKCQSLFSPRQAHWETKWRTADIQKCLNQKLAYFGKINFTHNHQKRVSKTIFISWDHNPKNF